MKKTFACSLCHNGILGGGLFLDEETLTYKTGKLTVDPKFRNLVLPRKDIREITWKWIAATIHMCDGTEYTFLIFNKPGFEKCYEQLRNA